MARVLVVDDEKSIRITVREFLLAAGYEVEIAEDAQVAQQLLATGRFDVVVTDIILPRVTGVELLRVIRRSSARVQVILMTGEPTVETAAEAVRAGAFDYLPKPINKQDILHAVGTAARFKALEDEKESLANANRQYQENLEHLVASRTAELSDSNDRLQRAIMGTVRAMALTVESRDPYTAGHQHRVALLARAIAEEMSLPEETIMSTWVASEIHDLGKIGIPAEILSKPGRLSDVEMALIRSHPEAGHKILSGIEFPWPIAQIVLQHHERLDGSGYPLGIEGDAILKESRIVAVADVIEAMSAHRPYRPALGLERAQEEIQRKKGSHFDPEVVEAGMRVFTERGFSFESETPHGLSIRNGTGGLGAGGTGSQS